MRKRHGQDAHATPPLYPSREPGEKLKKPSGSQHPDVAQIGNLRPKGKEKEKMKYTYFSVSTECRQDWENLCPINQFRIVAPHELPIAYPINLRNKLHRALVVASSLPNGVDYWMINGNRVDGRASAVDQQPFGIAFSGTKAMGSACLIHHGTWDGRTVYLGSAFLNYANASGSGHCSQVSELPAESSGNASNLRIQSQLDALNNVISALNVNIR